MAWASSTDSASGFSQKTWQPASIAALRVRPVGLGVRIDAHDVGLRGLRAPLSSPAELREPAQFRAERAARRRARG